MATKLRSICNSFHEGTRKSIDTRRKKTYCQGVKLFEIKRLGVATQTSTHHFLGSALFTGNSSWRAED
jgi:hypothetical protein